jgi:site-specific recombinase XerD
MARRVFGKIHDLYRAAGLTVPAAPWHCLRHSFASNFLMSGGHLVALSRLLGHTDLKTTQVYAHLSPDFLAEQLDKLKF